MTDPWGSGSAPWREKMERAYSEFRRRIKLEAKNDPAFVPTGNDASNILAARQYVLPPATQERGSNDANDVLASRVFQRPESTAGQGTPLNLPWTLVQRDSNGDFAASTVEVFAIKSTTHAGYDFALYAPNGTTYLLRVPTGTSNVEIVSGFLRVLQLRGTAATALDLQDSGGNVALSIPNGTTDVDIPTGDVDITVGDLTVGGQITAGQFIGDLTGNADTATALSHANQVVSGAGSSAALHSLIAKLIAAGINLTDSTTP